MSKERTNKRTETHACDTISRQGAIEEIKKCRFVVDAIEKIRELSPAEPECKKGKWEKYGGKIEAYDIVGYKTWGQKRKCTDCDFITTYIEDFGWYSFCPNCGADMRGEE